MDNTNAAATPRMRVYLCATCARRCLVVGEETEQRCICGGALTPALLAPGQYELIGQGAVESAKPSADLGYGTSHGYDATHGGPTGPGDAPAK